MLILKDKEDKQFVRYYHIATEAEIVERKKNGRYSWTEFYTLEEAKDNAYKSLVNIINGCFKNTSPRRKRLEKERVAKAKQDALDRKAKEIQDRKDLEEELKQATQKFWYDK